MEPPATRRTAQTATRPSQVTLLPMVSSSSWPPPTAVSHPRASPMGRASAGAAPLDGRRTGGWLVHPDDSTPACSRRASSSSFVAGSVPGPAAHTTSRPAAQEAWSRTSPADSSKVGSAPSSSAPVRRRNAASRRSRSSSKSATTWSRTALSRQRTDSRSASVRCRSRSSVQRQAERCSSSSCSCSTEASAAAAARTANSNAGVDTPAGGGSITCDTCCVYSSAGPADGGGAVLGGPARRPVGTTVRSGAAAPPRGRSRTAMSAW